MRGAVHRGRAIAKNRKWGLSRGCHGRIPRFGWVCRGWDGMLGAVQGHSRVTCEDTLGEHARALLHLPVSSGLVSLRACCTDQCMI